MALSFSRFSCPWMSGKKKQQASNETLVNSLNSLGELDLGFRDTNSMMFYSSKGVGRRVSSSKGKEKWKSRQERNVKVDKEYDLVLVPSDGVCLSGSESDDSDWSIGWLEPHAPCFGNDDEDDDSFAVLVPCYKQKGFKDNEEHISHFLNVKNLPADYPSGGKEYMNRWLSSLQNF